MKQTTVDSLLLARTLLERATELARADDRHMSSAALILLQDSLEIAFYGLLIEKGVDEQKSLEGKSFDELMGELKGAGVPVPRSGTLKALNKQRVLTKHYSQLAEPVTVRGYLDAALTALDSTVRAVTSRPLADLFYADFLRDGEAKEHLREAERLINEGKHFQATIEVRRAFYIEFEAVYSTYEWRNESDAADWDDIARYLFAAWKAPRRTRNKKWIEENVEEPTDYIQIDEDQWRIDALQWGIHTAELENIRRLTPPAFRVNPKSPWASKIGVSDRAHMGTIENAKYCLDRTAAAILRKQLHETSHRPPAKHHQFNAPDSCLGHHVREKASSTSRSIHIVNANFIYTTSDLVCGFSDNERFVKISGHSKELSEDGNHPKYWINGFLQVVKED